MTFDKLIRPKVFFSCLIVFLFSGCSMIVPPEQWAETELYWLCDHRYKIDNAEIMLDSFIENKKNIDIELKQRGKDCGCYYQTWSKSYLYMGLLGMGLQSNASKHCENDTSVEIK
ncbi:MAG: hypothetical protein HN472_02625 [Nitrospina sp.]|jgi:hypothetical protein|nr:hypothetical protein [Nitrospina sp.]MBT3921804.1 hypothetical protein [Nitrospina sp.]MBT6716331.1 hypothetical protein [Nitrospina sp.]MBT7708892.1 hypothetical protein [Nitrospina sp.]